jgi:hypothetical protein
MLHIQGKGSYKYVVSPLKCMSDSDLNDKFREYYAENGISAEQVANFDMNKLDYVHWGHHAVAFPSFFDVSSLTSLKAWAYSGYHGEDGVRLATYLFTVGKSDPRAPEYIVKRILSANDMHGVPTILIDAELEDDTDTVITKLPVWIYAAEVPEYLEGAMVNTFGGGEITLALHDKETVNQDYNFTVFAREEE